MKSLQPSFKIRPISDFLQDAQLSLRHVLKRVIHAVLYCVRWIDAAISDHFGPIRVLFVVLNVIGLAHQMPLIRGLAKRRGFRVAVALDQSSPLNYAKLKEQLAGVDVKIISGATATWSKWHYIIFTDRMKLYFHRWATYFYLNHGSCWGNFDRSQSFGTITKYDEYNDFVIFDTNGAVADISQAQSFACRDAFYQRNSSLKKGRSAHRVLVLGVPKLDNYRKISAIERRTRIAALSLNPDRATVILTSHWTSKGILPSLGFGVIETLLDLPENINVILLGHEKFWRSGEDRSNEKAAEVLQKVKSRVIKDRRLLFDPYSLENYKYLALGDVFICDKSSIFVECLLFDKPILFFNHPEFEFTDKNVGERYRLASKPFQDISVLRNLVREALNDPEQLAEERHRSLEYFLSRRGNATEFTISVIEHLGRASGVRSVRWGRVCQILDEMDMQDSASIGKLQ